MPASSPNKASRSMDSSTVEQNREAAAASPDAGVNVKPSGRRAAAIEEDSLTLKGDVQTVGTVTVENPLFHCKDVNVYYGEKHAIKHVSIDIGRGQVLAMIGPSGCGKSTFLRCLNRMNDTIPGVRVEGKIELNNQDIYAADVDLVDLRQKVGMVFQKPNPFPQSIYDNVAFGPRALKMKVDSLDYLIEQSLRGAALWDDVKNK